MTRASYQPILALIAILALVPAPTKAQQQSFEEANDIVWSAIGFCAQDLIPAAFPADETTFWAPPAQQMAFWACLYYGGWPEVDVVDGRFDRQLRVVQSILDTQDRYISNLTAVSRDSTTEPDWAFIKDEVLRFTSCQAWVYIATVAAVSRSDIADNEGGLPDIEALCGTTPDISSFRPSFGEMVNGPSLSQFIRSLRR